MRHTQHSLGARLPCQNNTKDAQRWGPGHGGTGSHWCCPHSPLPCTIKITSKWLSGSRKPRWPPYLEVPAQSADTLGHPHSFLPGAPRLGWPRRQNCPGDESPLLAPSTQRPVVTWAAEYWEGGQCGSAVSISLISFLKCI